jgi:uroporphyrinogen-III synthase
MIIVCTREKERNADLIKEFSERGLHAISLPLITTESLSISEEDRALIAAALDDPDCVICFSSPTAVKYGISGLPALRTPPRCSIAVQGTGTASAWEAAASYPASLIASGPTGSELAGTILKNSPPLSRAILIGAESPRPELAAILSDGGLSVSRIVAYRTVPRKISPEMASIFVENSSNVILFFSPSAVQAFRYSGLADRSCSPRCAAFGPTTAAAVRELGWALVVEHDKGSVEQFVDEIALWVRLFEDR